MDSMVKIFLQRAVNEISAAKLLFAVSGNESKKKEFELEEAVTFYSAAISHSYYAIFYSAKAILLTRGIRTVSPEIHKKTYNLFKKEFVDSGILDVTLLNIYKRMLVRADELLQIFKDEKWKRGHFTYHTIPQANKEPAEQSMENSLFFLKNIKQVLEKGE